MKSSRSQLHCIVSGRVQGPTFRDFVRNIAVEMNIVGFVAGLPDGSVEVLAQGEYGVLKVFMQHLARGPAGTLVTGVYDEWSDEPERIFDDFRLV
ncbi:MAG: acylphosphatase [Candidatus Pacebacteria bacterium]|nr:acylphosphatase [Candidatus Paceibacterota bacterium]